MANKKKGKYDLTIKTDLSPDELFNLAATTPLHNKSKKIAEVKDKEGNIIEVYSGKLLSTSKTVNHPHDL